VKVSIPGQDLKYVPATQRDTQAGDRATFCRSFAFRAAAL